MDCAELADFVELEGDDRGVGSGVVSPPDPSGGLGGLSDLIAAEPAVHELAKTAAQFLPPLPVVDDVRQLHAIASLITLRHRIRNYAHWNK